MILQPGRNEETPVGDRVGPVGDRAIAFDLARLGVARYKRKAMARTYAELKAQIHKLVAAGRYPVEPTRDQRIGYVHAHTAIDVAGVTRDMATAAVDRKKG